MTTIKIPKSYNYIGVFLTLRCNLNCNYCINRFDEFKTAEELGEGWIDGLTKIETRPDLPITFQGGEPTIHPYFYRIASELHERGKHLDLLTNGEFDPYFFASHLKPEVFKRKSKYANIRFSFHLKSNPIIMVAKVRVLLGMGYSVGVWGLDAPLNQYNNNKMKHLCAKANIDFRMKKFMKSGWERSTYKYPDACVRLRRLSVECKPSELLINPAGYIFRCHADLYAGRNPQGHILDNKVKLVNKYLPCNMYGWCNPCDVKLKFNRFQQEGHCSVKIKGKCVNERR